MHDTPALQKTILIADDDPNDRAMLRLGISATAGAPGFQFVHHGEEVVNYFAGKGIFADRASYPLPDILVLDFHMPRLDGLETLARLAASGAGSQLKTFILTSNEDPELAKAVAAAGAKLLRKPCLPAQWRDLVTGLIASL